MRRLTDYPCDPAAAGPATAGLWGHEGTRTQRPLLVSPSDASDLVLSAAEDDPALGRFFQRRISKTIRIRKLLQDNHRELRKIVGGENITFSFGARDGFSTDSTGHRGLVTEAVFSPPDIASLRRLMGWCYRNRVPVIPYGAGGGYNMGVVPMAPAVTVWPGAFRHIGIPEPHPEPRGRAKSMVRAEAGVPYADLIKNLGQQGLALRCVPNTPRASVGGIVATGSNGGKRIADIVVGGEAVLADGRLVRFTTSSEERRRLAETPFPLIHKFQGVPQDLGELRKALATGEDLPASLFVASEGTTGIITHVLLEVEDRPALALTAGIWLSKLNQLPAFSEKINSLDDKLKPVYFEFLTEPAISNYLAGDFPDLFTGKEEAYLILSFEDNCRDTLDRIRSVVSSYAPEQCRINWKGPFSTDAVPQGAARLKAPREALPGKLKTKCKADVEILLKELPNAIRRLSAGWMDEGQEIEAILFGHLSLGKSAILHWNIGGVNLTLEDEASRAWDYLERTLEELTCRGDDGSATASFTGEHGAAGKPSLFRASLARGELARLYRIKRLLDPRRILNPDTLFLPTRLSRALKGRALAAVAQHKKPKERIAEISTLCTRCNACQNCLVLDSQALLRQRRPRRNLGGWILGKRHLIQFLELLHTSRIAPEEKSRLLDEVRVSIQECISCGRCDEVCPVDIRLDDLTEIVNVWTGKEPRLPLPLLLVHKFLLAPAHRSGALFLSSLVLRATNSIARLLKGFRFSTHPLFSYLSLPPLGWDHYEAPETSRLSGLSRDLRPVGDMMNRNEKKGLVVRFKGCVGTVGRADATRNEDRFLLRVAGVSFFDFQPDLCCGYPSDASGVHTEARKKRSELIERLIVATKNAKVVLGAETVTVFSSCPTCQESLQKGLEELPNSSDRAFFQVRDPAEILEDIGIPRSGLEREKRKRVGLKIPCHATTTATKSQLDLLQRFGFDAVPLEQCCGMAGTGRLRHPEVGFLLAEQLAETIRNEKLENVISGCPSCRDGLMLQAALEGSEVETEDLYGFLLSTAIP